jgi:hypothetical protein
MQKGTTDPAARLRKEDIRKRHGKKMDMDKEKKARTSRRYHVGTTTPCQATPHAARE